MKPLSIWRLTAICACFISNVSGIQVTDADSVRAFLKGNRGATLAYVSRDDGCPYFIDFESRDLFPQRICGKAVSNSPMISPDGCSVLFERGGLMYVAPLERNASVMSLGAGREPHWWVDPANQNVFIVYSTQYGMYSWPASPGQTIRKQIDPITLSLNSDSLVLLDKSMKGGLSRSGRYLATGYSSGIVYDLLSGTEARLNGGNQTCNVSFMPSEDPLLESRVMFLVSPHSTFQIRTIQDALVWRISIPPGIVEWQQPEWSSHSDYCTAIATTDPALLREYDIYIVRISDTAYLRAADGNCGFPHLWMSGSGLQVVSSPVIAPGTDYFTDSLLVSIGCADQNALIHYTIDGSVPTENSSVYSGPFSIYSSTRLRARAYRSGATPSRITGASYCQGALRNADTAAIITDGISYQYHKLSYAPDKLPDFSTLTPTGSGVADSFYIPENCSGERTAIFYKGYIDIETAGLYRFFTISDDGSRLWIGDSLIVDNDGTHAALVSSGEIGLKVGYHRIQVGYFNGMSDGSLIVDYEGPGTARRTVPSGILFTEPERPITVLSPNGGEVLRIGDTMIVRWSANSVLVSGCVVDISFDSGRSWAEIVRDAVGPSDESWGAYRWKIPVEFNSLSAISATCRIRVRDYENAGLSDMSDTDFKITTPSNLVSESRSLACDWSGLRIVNGVLVVPNRSAGKNIELVFRDLAGRQLLGCRLSGNGVAKVTMGHLPRGILVLSILSENREIYNRRLLAL